MTVPTRLRVWLAFTLEAAAILAVPLALTQRIPLFVVAAALYLLCGCGWLILRQYRIGAAIIAVRVVLISPLSLIILWLVYPAGLNYVLVGLGLAIVLVGPIVSSLALAFTWFPRVPGRSEPISA